MIYRFEEFELDTGMGELRRRGRAVSVEPQVFELLHYFVSHPARLVSPDELVQSVWSGRVVSDSAIAARISAARKALGDDGKTQSLIRTVVRRGFRFLPAVEVIAGTEADESAAESPASQPEPDEVHQRVSFCQSADGTNIAYAVTGTGPPLLRTGHWLTHLEHDWRSPIWRPLLNEFGKRFTVVRYDQRGNGLSDWRVPEFSWSRFIEDLEAVVEASGIQRFVLYGTSQGAAVAVEYAVRHPERVSHLILHGGYVLGRLVRGDRGEVETGEAIIKLIEHGWGRAGSPFLKSFSAMFAPDSTQEQLDSLADLQRLTTNAANARSIREAVDSFDISDSLPRVRVPTLILHARDDGVHPLEEGRRLASNIPGSEFVLLESANHVLVPQEPAWPRFFSAIDRFTRQEEMTASNNTNGS